MVSVQGIIVNRLSSTDYRYLMSADKHDTTGQLLGMMGRIGLICTQPRFIFQVHMVKECNIVLPYL